MPFSRPRRSFLEHLAKPAWDEIKPSTINPQELVKVPEPLKAQDLELLLVKPELLEVVERVEKVTRLIKAPNPWPLIPPRNLSTHKIKAKEQEPPEVIELVKPPPMIKAKEQEPPEVIELAKVQEQEPPEAIEVTELAKPKEQGPPEATEITELAKAQEQEPPEAIEVKKLAKA
ncbi:hypothetical protein MY1884_009646 [Beauveria asiatica]